MKSIKNYLAFVLLFTGIPVVSAQTSSSVVHINIDMNKEAQTISGFGASDAWSCQFIGKNWPADKKEQVADWLFSSDTLKNGQPKGIGLSIWRFNIGGGTIEQGDSSNIGDEWRRAECFLNADGSYNWAKQSGQQWFMKAAKDRGVKNFIAFLNTPPVYFTKNGKGWSSGGNSVNLKPEKYSAYTDFLVSVLQHFNKEGFTFNILSPFNEPQWNWDGKGQEGTPCRNAEMYSCVKELSTKFSAAKLKTTIEIPEAGQINYLYQDSSNLEQRDNQIYSFFSPQSPLYIGALPNISQSIAGHSYFTTFDVQNMKDMRKKLHEKMLSVDNKLIYNMTEYCILEDNQEIKGGGRDLGINPAIYIAKVIHYDLTVANASSWQWWVAVSPYDYKDGLVYTDYNKTDGNIFDSKMLWCLGQYSRFVRPGMKRVEVENEREDETLLVSAFKSTDSKKLVTVIVNVSDKDQQAKLSVRQSKFKTYKLYQTTANPQENIKPKGQYKVADNLTVPARSVVTLEF
jgi:O-glycosyl hydrolase